MTDLVEFLRARLNEDEEAALRSRNAPADALRYVDADEWSQGLVWLADEDRVLREVKAKRLVLDEYGKEARVMEQGHRTGWTEGGQAVRGTMLRVLAAAYVDHPDYQQEWNLNLA